MAKIEADTAAQMKDMHGRVASNKQQVGFSHRTLIYDLRIFSRTLSNLYF